MIFNDAALAKLVAETLPPAEQATLAVVGTVDQAGAQVVAGFTSESGKWNLTGAYRHEWTSGDNSASARLMFKF